MTSLPIFVAFLAGIVSFLSPCVLPIIPGFLAYMAGASSSTSTQKTSSGVSLDISAVPPQPSRWVVFANSIFFVLGFSIVFALLGVLLNGVLAHSAYAVQTWLARIGGAIVIFFGFYLMGFFKINFFEFNHTMKFSTKLHSRYLTSLLFGFAFAAGWTPCVGPVLAGILGLAASAPSQAFSLLLAYAIGLGIPFLIVGLFVAQTSEFINKYVTKLSYIGPIFGGILVILGILVFTQDLPLIANLGFLNDIFIKFKI
jgi:cytochrome c-type biogenesis protein